MVDIRQGGEPVCGFRVSSVHSKPFSAPSQLPGFLRKGDEQYLTITLSDNHTGLVLELRYVMIAEFDAIVRSLVIRNDTDRALSVERAFSALVQLPPGERDLVHLPGAWARERRIERHRPGTGTFSFGSLRGASSHFFSPSAALLEPGTGERSGEARGFSLVYSGSFLFSAETDQDGGMNVLMGLNPEGFSWNLAPGKRFETPELVMVYADDGLGGLSRRFHRFTRERIIPERWAGRERPVLLNNWEATYFDFDEDKLGRIIDSAAELGIELFVLDDGWFGGRNDDTTSLGDWYVNRKKLPGGLEAVAKKAHEAGMQFGLWFEPEMVSEESELFRLHPDWCLHIPGRPRPEGRNQLVLDICREDVRDALFNSLSGILDTGLIDYVKWDMNRSAAPLYSPVFAEEPMGNCAYRYAVGLYELFGRFTSAYPDILFEGCSGGGGRYDAGVLAYMPQYWTSDNTDAFDRIAIQEGTSLFFPPVSMGSHVSAVPNHQTGRRSSSAFRFAVAAAGNLGYELDPLSLGVEERLEISWQISFYRKHRKLIQGGDFYRLEPSGVGEHAWITVARDDGNFILFWFHPEGSVNRAPSRLRLFGIDSASSYIEEAEGTVYGGDELLHRGLIHNWGDAEGLSAIRYFHTYGEQLT
jgi:alpha-galactosidase